MVLTRLTIVEDPWYTCAMLRLIHRGGDPVPPFAAPYVRLGGRPSQSACSCLSILTVPRRYSYGDHGRGAPILG